MNIFHFLTLSIFILLKFSSIADAKETGDAHFASWDEVPTIIESISTSNYAQQLKHLHELTRIQLGWPQDYGNKEVDERYVLHTKARWKAWWNSTGQPVTQLKKHNSKPDGEALAMAWEFLGTRLKKNHNIPPVWIPETWTLCVTFTNGDYLGREKEIWMIQRVKNSASLTKLRGDYSHGPWSVSLEKYDKFTPKQADRILKALCYLHLYAPSSDTKLPQDNLTLYYPGARLHLWDGKQRILWNTQGYSFSKTRAKHGNGAPGRSYRFLRKTFFNTARWQGLIKPSAVDLAPYRNFLTNNKPYFCSNASDVVLLFGKYGGKSERKSLQDWAKKQKIAIDPNSGWQSQCGDFGSHLKVNVVNSTRLELETTVKQIKRISKRLNLGEKADEEDLALTQDVIAMHALEKKEKESDIMRHPQPLRDLVRANRHPNDPDLKHLKAAIEHIRKKPDPKLFKQIAVELDDGAVEMSSLLGNIMLDEHGLMGLKPWGKKEKTIAVHACIEALPIAQKIGELSSLVEIILKVCGGGKIQIKDGHSGRSIKVVMLKNGYSLSTGGADNPLPMADAQKKLKELYSRSKQE